MEDLNREKHWNHIYETKELKEVSWYQPKPETSLAFIEALQLPKSASIIDMGGGDSFLVDHLLAAGFENITVLDISEKAIEKAKHRLGDEAQKVEWVVADVARFQAEEKYDVWHDRAAFHFLTDEVEVSNYVKSTKQHVKPKGHLIIGTFSENGPKKCSGIEIKQYSKEALTAQFQEGFEKVECINHNHETPSGSIQNFTFCKFKKVEA
ncbi:class I SAM-dependent methyltransferase [Psychroflexus planctonicus]|uniref:class I SAM-dependent methyltransferase n=1 Tax=Psychroflexus planctonicus TaxID=1526575 RepID=UPI0016678517|nr:class I SAM-dependent methyltransferase [Psychroflexus planctonicus]